MYRLRISFTCLCAYLPRKDEVLVVIPDGRMGMPGDHSDHAKPKDEALIGIPDGRMGTAENHADHGGPKAAAAILSHVPVIELDSAHLSPKSEVQPDLHFRRPNSRRDWGLVFLTGNDISLVDPAPSGAPTLRNGRAPKTDAP